MARLGLRRLVSALALILLCTPVTPAHAQADSTPRTQLLQRLHVGTELRIQRQGQLRPGRFVRVSPDTLYLDSLAVPLAAIDNIWLKQRATRRVARIGAIVGAPAGAVFGGFLLLFVHALCEYDCSDVTAGEIILVELGFTAFGALSGAAVGAVIGAALPQWVPLTDRRARIPSAGSAPPASRVIGSLAVTPAFAKFRGGEEGGVGLRGTYMYHTHNFGLGLEAARYDMGDNFRERISPCSSGGGICTDTVPLASAVSHYGGIARVGTGADNHVEPYATLGLGLYSWKNPFSGSLQFGGYSLGGGVLLRNSTGKRYVFTEARWQSNLTRSGDVDGHYGFYTLGIGGALAW